MALPMGDKPSQVSQRSQRSKLDAGYVEET